MGQPTTAGLPRAAQHRPGQPRAPQGNQPASQPAHQPRATQGSPGQPTAAQAGRQTDR